MTGSASGLVLAKVVDVEDPEQLGRIRVEYLHLTEGVESAWAPVVVPFAGPDAGFFMMPDPDDIAVVGFGQGRIDQPMVLGFIWNGDQAPPATEVTERRMVSRNGHSITLSDGDDDGITLEDAHGNKIVMNSDGITIETQGELKVSSQSTATLESPGEVTVKGNPIQLNP